MKRDSGFIGILVLIIIALAALKYFFNWSIFDAAESEEGRSTISYIRQVFDTIWLYIAAPVKFIWNDIIWPFFTFIKQGLLEWGKTKTT